MGRTYKQIQIVAAKFGVNVVSYTPDKVRRIRFIWGPDAFAHCYDSAPDRYKHTCKGKAEADTFLAGIQVAALNGIKYEGE